MAIVVKINGTDRTDHVEWESLRVEQVLTSQVDIAELRVRKYGSRTLIPAVNDTILISDGSEDIFGGRIVKVDESAVNGKEGLVYLCQCVDHSYEFDSQLVSKTYQSQTVEQIIADIVSSFTTGGFTTTNVQSDFLITRIVFNQVSPSLCLKRLADLLQYHWYIDPDKDVHFFPKFTESAPFNLTDDSGNYMPNSLIRSIEGAQIANKVVVRGGEYNAASYTDVITVKGNDSKTFQLPYKFANLAIEVNTGAGYVAKTLGIDFIDDPTTKDVLYNYNERTIKFNAALADGNRIRFTGNPKVPVLAVAENPDSIAAYGIKEKIIRDTSIEDLDTARRRGAAELLAYKDALNDIQFSTYESGLRAGQTININSVKRSVDQDFIVRKVTFRTFGRDSFKYDVELVTTKKYGFIEMLQKLLEPDSMQASSTEVAEKIKTDVRDLTVVESVMRVTPEIDAAALAIAENIQKDPLGAGVEPDWVLADYFPTSPSDTKRTGLLDRELKTY